MGHRRQNRFFIVQHGKIPELDVKNKGGHQVSQCSRADLEEPHDTSKRENACYAEECASTSGFHELDTCKRRGKLLTVLTNLGATKEVTDRR